MDRADLALQNPNGYKRDQLFAIDLKNPNARNVDATAQEGRSSTDDVMKELAAYVTEVKKKTGATKVALVGNSRGANTIRNYVKNGGGKDHVSHVVLGGGVNHGVIKSDTALIGSEFNGNSEFMKKLNAGTNEVVAGVKFMTIRSDRFDKFAQPDGMFIGMAGKPTGISYDAPALKGAVDFVLPGLDHREVSYSLAAFVETYRFITGRVPPRLEILPEKEFALNGNVTGITGGAYDNTGVSGAEGRGVRGRSANRHAHRCGGAQQDHGGRRCRGRSPPNRTPITSSSSSAGPGDHAHLSDALPARLGRGASTPRPHGQGRR